MQTLALWPMDFFSSCKYVWSLFNDFIKNIELSLDQGIIFKNAGCLATMIKKICAEVWVIEAKFVKTEKHGKS